MSDLWERTGANERLARVLAVHFDPDGGTPFWLERAAELGFDPRREVRTVDDLSAFGEMDADALADRPIEEVTPRSLARRRPEFLLAETGGTTGHPRFAVHRQDEFAEAFVEPFVRAAELAAFPPGANWLYVGPTGPHVIGKAASACARATGSPDVFSVDFDPRWARKLPAGSFARQRYLAHVQAQALRICEVQRIGVVFSTPPVLAALCEQLSEPIRQGIGGVHFGGMPVSAELRDRLCELLPNAVLLSGYGNTLMGVMPELTYSRDGGIGYFPHGVRLIVRTIPLGDEPAGERLSQVAPPGERGQVVVHRLDETQLIVNMVERDTGIATDPPEAAAAAGFVLPGVRDPQPLVSPQSHPAGGGLY